MADNYSNVAGLQVRPATGDNALGNRRGGGSGSDEGFVVEPFFPDIEVGNPKPKVQPFLKEDLPTSKPIEDMVAATSDRASPDGRTRRLLAWIQAQLLYDFSKQHAMSRCKECGQQCEPKGPNFTTVWANLILLIAVWIGTGLAAVIVSFGHWRPSLGGERAPDDLAPPSPLVPEPLNLPSDRRLAAVVLARDWILLFALVAASFAMLADRRGGLMGARFFREHFNFFLYVSRVLNAISFFNLAFAIMYGADRFMWQAALIWAIACFAKVLSWKQAGKTYILLNVIWLELSAGAVLYVCLNK